MMRVCMVAMGFFLSGGVYGQGVDPRIALALAQAQIPRPQEVQYEWEQVGQQWGLRGEGGRQVGVWIPGDGYYPLLRDGRWGAVSAPPIAPPTGPLRTAPKEVKPAAIPFRPTGWPLPSAAHDADLEAAGPWPKELSRDHLDGMKRYKRAAYTQEIAVTNGYDRITPVRRDRVEATTGPRNKWQQSGGLHGQVAGFRSDLYRNDARPWTGVRDISVLNSFGYMQDNRGWVRIYPDGARFMDVLSSNGEVFEIRQLEKVDGKWKPRTLYVDEKARPDGYKGLTVSCFSCHSEAGTGGYGTGLVPGGDFIISDPFEALER